MTRSLARALYLSLAALALVAVLWLVFAVWIIITGWSAIAHAQAPELPKTLVINRTVRVSVPRMKREPMDTIKVPLPPTETFIATAYSSGYESTGKRPGDPEYGITYSGLPVHPGVVAVDPDVIPLGSIVWIEGYGIAVALDVGSAVRGKHVDVYFDDVERARSWGRKKVQVAILRGGRGE